jgi:hypothetical protein
MGTVGSFSGSKAAGREADNSHLHLVPRQKKIAQLYLHSPVRYHGVVLN